MNVEGVSPQEMQALGTALNYVAKTPLERLGHIIDARMSYWHFTNLLATAEKVQAKLEAKGLSPEQLDPKLREIVPMLESAKNEDNPTLQEMWVSLLAASLDPDIPDSTLQYHELLKLISPLDANLLNLLGLGVSTMFDRLTPNDNYDSQVEVLAELSNADNAAVTLSLQHLAHLGLVLWPGSEAPYLMLERASEFISLSRVGESLLQRCAYVPDTPAHA
jgi:hypothetical protein